MIKKSQMYLLAVVALLAAGTIASAQDKHWLIGNWRGEVPAFTNAPQGPKRAFDVSAVAADGAAQGKWGIEAANANTTTSVQGDKVSILVAGSNSRIEMIRAGDTLTGTFTLADGRSYPIRMAREGTALSAAAPAPAAPLTKAEFAAPAIGTRFVFSTTTQEITAIDGKAVSYTNASGNNFTRYGVFYGHSNINGMRFARDKIDALWPLEVGKSASFDVNGSNANGAPGTWYWSIKVAGTEDIETPAGKYQAFIVEARERSSTGEYEGVFTYWYAPRVNYYVRQKYDVIRGTARPYDISLRSIQRPKG